MEVDAERFENAWPQLGRSLHAALVRRGVSHWLADDIVQETGMRLLKHWDRIDPDRSVWGLTLTIAQNVLRDEVRSQARRPTQELDLDLPGANNLEEEVLARVELDRVRRGLDELTSSQRSVLLTEVGGAEDTTSSPAAIKMMRMRARRRLRTVLERASMGVAGIKWRIESEVAQIHAAIHRNDLTPGSYLMSPAAGVLSALTVMTAALAIADVFPSQAEASTRQTDAAPPFIYEVPAERMKREMTVIRQRLAPPADMAQTAAPKEKRTPPHYTPAEPPEGASRALGPVYASAGSEGTENPVSAERYRVWADTATKFAGHSVSGGVEMVLENPDCDSQGCKGLHTPGGSAHASVDDKHHAITTGPDGDDRPDP